MSQPTPQIYLLVHGTHPIPIFRIQVFSAVTAARGTYGRIQLTDYYQPRHGTLWLLNSLFTISNSDFPCVVILFLLS